MTNDTIYAKFDDDGFVTGFWQSAAYDAPAEDEDRNPFIPADAIEITQAQFDEIFEFQGLRKWVDGQVVVYDPPPPEPVVPDVVSSRRFFLQLDHLDETTMPGVYDQVMGWVATQPRSVQLAFNKSATFRRDDEMMQQGFAALGFTVEQVDQFFTAAAGL